MKRFKIKYTNTKGIIKIRNIKATSEARAMSEIKDMSQHHYTIAESADDPGPDPKQIWEPIITGIAGLGFSQEKINMITELANNQIKYLQSQPIIIDYPDQIKPNHDNTKSKSAWDKFMQQFYGKHAPLNEE